MIYFGAIFGGPDVADGPFHEVLRKILIARGPAETSEAGSLDIVFHVPGSILGPKFEGIRTGSFSRKKRILQIQIAVPKTQVDTPKVAFILNAVRDAIRLASPKFAKASIAYAETDYLETIDRIERELRTPLDG